jgi:hypothetical protein
VPIRDVLELAQDLPLLFALLFFLLSIVSLWWTTRAARRILRQSLKRPLRPGEETSLSTWMALSSEEIDAASRKLTDDLLARLPERLQDLTRPDRE